MSSSSSSEGSTTETVGLLVVFSRLFLYRFNLETWKLDDIVFNLVGDESQLIKKKKLSTDNLNTTFVLFFSSSSSSTVRPRNVTQIDRFLQERDFVTCGPCSRNPSKKLNEQQQKRGVNRQPMALWWGRE